MAERKHIVSERCIMKRWLIALSFIIVAIVMTFTASGCSIPLRTETDGVYEYYYEKNEDAYSIVGRKFEITETVILPAYYKSKPIVAIGHTVMGMIGATTDSKYLDLEGAKTVYYPFGVELGNLRTPDRIYFVCNTEQSLPIYSTEDVTIVAYLTKQCYEKKKQSIIEGNEGVEDSKWIINITETDNNYMEISRGKHLMKVHMANTAYMFNYDGAPNDNYFFINNFESGGLIEDSPYYPERTGYTFGGWYKEAECLNKWDFSADTLDSEALETRLYAKWTVKS